MSDSGDPKQDKQRELEAEYEHYHPEATDVSSSESSGEPPTLRKLAPVSPNTNIEIDGQEFELVIVADAPNFSKVYGLKPVKKTEDKEEYKLQIWPLESAEDIYSEILDLTPTAADKLSEAISALVEWMQDPKSRKDYDGETPIPENIFFIKAAEAKQSFQESQ
jgi:hypothetical protein